MGKKLILLILCVVFLSTASYATEIKGTVVAYYDMVVLLDTGKGKTVPLRIPDEHDKSPKARLINMDVIHDIKMWDRLRAKGEMVSGMLVASEAELPPLAEFDHELKFWADELTELVGSGGDYVLVDTRPECDYEAWHIPTAVSMPEFISSRLPDDKDTKIVVYALGARDPSAAEFARKAVSEGYTNVWIYIDGIQQWVDVLNYHSVTTSKNLKKMLSRRQPVVIADVRSPEEFEVGHIEGAISMPLDKLKRDMIMPMTPYPAVFYGNDAEDARAAEAAKRVASWGYGRMSGTPVSFLEEGLKEWADYGGKVEVGFADNNIQLPPGVITKYEFKYLWAEGGAEDKVILDVRLARHLKWNEFSFLTVIPIETFPYRIDEIPKDKEIIVFCAAGYRSRIVYEILKRNGYDVRYLNRIISLNRDGSLN